jgi:dethiobiotin synthetase
MLACTVQLSIISLDKSLFCQVAALLGLPMILVVNGGLGSAFDELSQNIDACHMAGAQVKGVLVNKVSFKALFVQW